MADDLKSLAARIKALEDAQKKPDPEFTEVKRNVSYIKGILDTQNEHVTKLINIDNTLKDHAEKIKALRERVTKLEE